VNTRFLPLVHFPDHLADQLLRRALPVRLKGDDVSSASANKTSESMHWRQQLKRRESQLRG
jgi:hypothetical protein